MELRQLRYLLTIAEEAHFTRAAERLYVSQPALSQQLRQLEDELGTRLVDRSGRQICLTPAGEILVQHARQVFQVLDDAQVALTELAGLQRGTLAVGVVQTVNAYLLPRVVARFRLLYPGVSLRIEEASADTIEQGLLNRTLHLGISFVPTANGLDTEPLFTEELMLIVPHAHPLARRAWIAVSELEGVALVLLAPGFCTRRLWDACAHEAHISPRVVVEMNTVQSVLATLLQMEAATVLPTLALASDLQPALAGVRLVQPTPQRTVALLWRQGAFRSAASRAFAQVVQEELGVLQTVACA